MSHPYSTSGGCWVRLHTYDEGFLGIFEAQSQTQHLIVLPHHPTQIQVRLGQCMYYVHIYEMYVFMYVYNIYTFRKVMFVCPLAV